MLIDGPFDRVGSSRAMVLNAIQYTIKIVSISDIDHQVGFEVTATSPASPQLGITHILSLVETQTQKSTKFLWVSKIPLTKGSGPLSQKIS